MLSQLYLPLLLSHEGVFFSWIYFPSMVTHRYRRRIQTSYLLGSWSFINRWCLALGMIRIKPAFIISSSKKISHWNLFQTWNICRSVCLKSSFVQSVFTNFEVSVWSLLWDLKPLEATGSIFLTNPVFSKLAKWNGYWIWEKNKEINRTLPDFTLIEQKIKSQGPKAMTFVQQNNNTRWMYNEFSRFWLQPAIFPSII